jgi:PilZ domain
MGDESEQRNSERVTINKEFESFDAFVSEYVTNVSKTGAFVRSDAPLPVGTKVNLRFSVVMDGVETVEGIGEVVRVHEDPPGMGIVFTELTGYSEAIIARLLTARGGAGG